MTQPTSAPSGTMRHRRLASAVVGVALMAATIGLAAAPAGAAVPGTPRAMQAIGYSDGVRVYFAPPLDDGGSPITKYTISRVKDPFVGPQIPDTWMQTDTKVLFDTTAVAGTGYKYTVTATNASGESAASDAMNATRSTTTFNEYSKFAGSVPSFVNRQYHDLLGRLATPTELSDAQTALAGTTTPYAFIDTLYNADARVFRKQVTRLYFAYFKRVPDHGGLTYWTTQLNTHHRGLDDESNSFARSNEFKTTYGALSDLDFVTLVYHNVLDRDPDATGLTFWLGQLSTHSATRGRMMTQFSESNEYKGTSRGRVIAADLWDSMLGQAIPAAQLALIGGQVQGGGTAGLAATYIINQALYTVV